MSYNKLSYTGEIKAKVYNKKTKKWKFLGNYHNNGRWPLFNFISNCLRGDYKVADTYIPYTIGLFSVDTDKYKTIPVIEDEIINLENLSEKDIQFYLKNERLISNKFVPISSSAINTDSNYSIGKSSISFTFEIPYSSMNIEKIIGSENSYYPINLICLYPKGKTPKLNDSQDRNILEPLAYCFIRDSNDSTKWDNLLKLEYEISNLSNYNLVIEWKLNFNNNLNYN